MEQRLLLASDWQNACNRHDVNDDGVVSPLDALLVINQIARSGDDLDLPRATPDNYPPSFVDVNGGNQVTPLDALLVINDIARNGITGELVPSVTELRESGESFVIAHRCSVILHEGDQFETKFEQSFVVPDAPSAIQFSYDIVLDTADPDFINDAFEAALVDEDGNPLVGSYAPSRDAYFNATESLESTSSQGIESDGQVVTVGLGGLVPGTSAHLIVRLINNDSDQTTTARISRPVLVSSDLFAPPAASSELTSISNGISVVSLDVSFPVQPETTTQSSQVEPEELSPLPVGSFIADGYRAEEFIVAGLDVPFGFDVDRDGNAYVVNVARNGSQRDGFLTIHDNSGTLVRTINGPLITPTDVAVDPSGDIYITDTSAEGSPADDHQDLIFRVAADSSTIEPFAGNWADDGVPNPKAVVIDSVGNLIISDNELSARGLGGGGGGLVRVSPAGDVSLYVNNIQEPGEIAIDAEDNVFVANNLNARIGKTTASIDWVTPEGTVTTIYESDHRINGLVVDSQGALVFWNNGRILRHHDVNGNRLIEDGETEILVSGIPVSSMAIDDNDNLFVTQANNNRVVKIVADPAAPSLFVNARTPVGQGIPGESIVLSGRAVAVSGSLTHVTVNGRPVDVLDASGHFFHVVELETGKNDYRFTAHNEFGQTATTSLLVLGRDAVDAEVDFSRYADITDSFSGVYGRTSYHEKSWLLHVDLATSNDGAFETDMPLLVGVKIVDGPSVSIVGADGLTPDGIPFYDFSDRVSGEVLGSGDQTDPKTIRFHNPDKTQFDYELVFYGALNEAPIIESLPSIEAAADREYRYDVLATDPDDDTLSYSLSTRPDGMQFDPGTSGIIWQPTVDDLGYHDVVVTVSDGRGGTAEQRFTIEVIEAPPNRPPIITSTPVTMAVLDFSPPEDLVLNGSFETPLVPGGVFQEVPPDIPGWSPISGGGRFGFDFHGSIWRSADGNQHIEFDWVGATLEQSFSQLIEDAEYELRFSLTGNPDFGVPNFLYSMFVDVRSNDLSIASDTFSVRKNPNRNSVIWTDFGLRFVAPSSDATIRFTRTDGGIGGFGVDLDHVRLAQVPGDGFSPFGDTYNYQLLATDADDDILTYELLAVPTGMTLTTAGHLSWSPGTDDVGHHAVAVQVSDGRGGFDTQEFTVCVHPDPENNPPTIISDPTEVITEYTSITQQLGDEDFFGFGTDSVGEPVPVIEFDNRSPQDPSFTDFDLRHDRRLRSQGEVINEWTHDLSELVGSLNRIEELELSLAIGGIQDGNTSIPELDDRLFFEGIEVEDAFDSLDQGVFGTGLLTFSLNSDQLETLRNDNVLDIRIEGGFVNSGNNESYFIDYSKVNATVSQRVFRYDTEAIDPDGDDLIYSITRGPTGIEIDPESGVIEYVTSRNENLIRNASFEAIPSTEMTGQEVLASEWFRVGNVTGAEILSNDSSYGSPNSDWYNDGRNISAYDGNRFVAGQASLGESLAESFGQTLSEPLVSGTEYSFSASVILNSREPESGTGAYRIALSNTQGLSGDSVIVGEFSPVDDTDSWQYRRITFTAPTNASALQNLILIPYSSVTGSPSYVGIDELSLLPSSRFQSNANRNLVVNGGLESGHAGGWVDSDFEVVDEDRHPTVPVIEGRHYFWPGSGSASNQQMTQLVDLSRFSEQIAAGGFELSVGASVITFRDEDGFVSFIFRDREGTEINRLDFTALRSGILGEWIHLENTIQIDPNTVFVEVQLRASRPRGSLTDVFFDDVFVRATNFAHPVEIVVNDQRGGIDQQSFSIELGHVGSGTIEGRKTEAASENVAQLANFRPEDTRILLLTGDGQLNSAGPVLIDHGFEVVSGSLNPGEIASAFDEYPDIAQVWVWNDGSYGNSLVPADPTRNFSTEDLEALQLFNQAHPEWVMDGLAWRTHASQDELNLTINIATQLSVAGGGIVLGADDALSDGSNAVVQHVNQVSEIFGFEVWTGVYQVTNDELVQGGKLLSSPYQVLAENLFTSTASYAEVPNGLQQNGIFLSTAIFGSPGEPWSGSDSAVLEAADFNGVTYQQVNHLVTTSIVGGGIDARGLSNWTIYLDQNENGVRDVGERFTTTDENGMFRFTGLSEGTYFVREEVQQGWLQTYPGSSQPQGLVSISESTGEIFEIDPVVGTATPIGNSVLIGDALEFVDSSTGYIAHNGNRISRFDLVTGTTTVIALLDGVHNIEGLAFDDARGLVYATVSTAPDGEAERLALVDLENSEWMEVAVFGDEFTDVDSLAILPDGRLIFSQLSSPFLLGTYDPTSNTLETIGSLEHSIIGLDVDKNGKILGTSYDLFTDGSETLLLNISLDGPTSTPIGVIDMQVASGLAFLPDHLIPLGYQVEIVENETIENINFRNRRAAPSTNNSPAFFSEPSNSVTFFDLYRYDAAATDPENDPLQYSLLTHPDGMTVHPTLGSVVWIPKEDQRGEHQVVLAVSDPNGGTDLQSFTITVTEPNNAPEITSTPIQSAIAGQNYRYVVRTQDADVASGDVLSYELAEGHPEGMQLEFVEVTNSGGMIVDQYHLVAWDVPAELTDTTHDVTLIVTDAAGATDSQSWTISVLDPTSANNAPIIQLGGRTSARHGTEWVYPVLAYDPDGEPIQYSLAGEQPGMTISDSGLITWSVPVDAPSESTFEVVVTDSRGLEARESLTVSVVSVDNNAAPVIDSVPPTVAVIDTNYAYDPVAIDPDGDSLFWELAAAPRGMSIDSRSGKIRWTPDDQQIGEHFVAVTATDPFLGSFTQRYSIHVGCSNLAPAILSVPPTVALTDRTYIYPVRADDFENDPLTWSVSTAPDNLSIDPQTGLIRWTPTNTQLGSHSIVIEVSDGLNVGSQSYTVVVSDSDAPADPSDPDGPKNGNRAPIFRSTPVYSAEVDALYQYQVSAIDPDGDDLTYGFGAAVPDGMEITGGLITWTPTLEDVGVPLIIVTATDQHDAVSSQGYALAVAENQAPQITSTPIETVTRGSTYRYTASATDPENDPLTWSHEANAPDGMTIDANGRILWDTSATTADSVEVTVTVADDRGQTDSDTWTITVEADTQAPSVSILVKTANESFFGDGQIDVDSSYTVELFATDNVGVTDIELLVDGMPVTLDADFTAVLTASTTGSVSLEAIATDAAGLQGTALATVTVVDPANTNRPVIGDPDLPTHPGVTDPTDTQPPIVEITSPIIGATITTAVPIIGTVQDPEDNLWYYQALYARADRVSITSIDLDDPDWTIFHESTEPVVDGEIAVFDPAALSNDAYALAIVAYDINAAGWVEPTMVFVEGNVQVANFRIELTDLSLPLNGIPIEVTRVYDTDNAPDEGDFGHGWNLGVQDPRILETIGLSIGGALNGGTDKLVPGRSKIYLNNPAGQRIGFTYEERLVSFSFFGGIYRAEFVPDPGVYDTLTIDNPTVARGGLIGALAQGINPDVYTLTTKEGTSYRYNQFTGLETITDLNGNVVTFSEDGITHSSGESIEFIRDHRGRIKEVVDPSDNRIVYEYDAAGDLVGVTDLLGLTTTYTYRNEPAHFLDQAFDPQGDAVMTAVYEKHPDFRIYEFKGIIDAAGNRIDDRDFDTLANIGVVRDANGNPTTLLYDDRGNVTEETDPFGNVTFREYGDPNNPDLETRMIDRRGFITDREYDSRGNVTRIMEVGTQSDPFTQPIVTEFTYDSGNRVSSITNAQGATTAFTYDSSGNLLTIVNAEGNSSSFTYDGQGRRETFTDFNGNTTTFDYTDACPCGSPSRVTFADGTYQVFEYNQFGQVTLEAYYESDGTLAEQRTTVYDNAGRVLEEKSGIDGDPNHPPTIVRRFYDDQLLDWEIIVSPESLDESGNLMESPATPVDDRFSRITDYEYDQNDRLIRQIDAEAWWNPATERFEGREGTPRGVVEFRYDAQGNRILLQDPVGNITTWVYDGLNRVVEERDPFYWVDAVEADATLQTLSNAQLLERIAPIVPVSPADPSDPRDPLYDDPSGASCETNTAADHIRLTCYDAEGNQSHTIDRNARRREFSYDHAGRLLEERWYNEPDHATEPNTLVENINFTYDVLGNMLTASDSNSNYLHTYDILNRLTSVDNNPDGTRDVPRVILNYEYDAQGNVIKTFDDAGVTVESEYDSRNRLAIRKWYDADVPTGEDPDVDPARVDFLYNAAGRESDVFRYSDLDANELVGRTERTYDAVGRSDDLIHRNATDELLSGYDYDYDFNGLLTAEERSHQDEQYAQTIDYRYDLVGQLTFADFDTQDDERYAYSSNGNRITSEFGDDQRIYQTAFANQLLNDGQYRYEYDDEGNQVKRVPILPDGSDDSAGIVRTIVYDHRNRLVRVDDWNSDPGDPQDPTTEATLTQSVEYVYDVFARRIVRNLDPDGAAIQSKEQEFYIFDAQNVWIDIDTAGTPIARYLFAHRTDSLLRLQARESTGWVLVDRSLSARDLLDNSLAMVRTQFSAYGASLLSDPQTRYGFLGREADASTSLQYFRARVYDPELGRFLSNDPLQDQGGSWNYYSFVANDPINNTDPTGENIVAYVSIAFAISLVVPAISCFIDGAPEPVQSIADNLCPIGTTVGILQIMLDGILPALGADSPDLPGGA
ncbi:MAG: putative Ig domain-containing protein [Planctomycetota bacterium]